MKVIDYLIYIKLIFLNKNIYLENNYYYEIVSYLFPYIDSKYIINQLLTNKLYEEDMNINLFISKYNFNKIYLQEKSYLNNNIHVYINYILGKNDIYDNILYIKVSFYYLSGYIINFLLDYFIFDIPLSKSNKIYINYKDFHDSINNIWSESSTICMSEFIYSSSIKKLLYYQLYKKCFSSLFMMQLS